MILARRLFPAILLCLAGPLAAQQANEFDLETTTTPTPSATTGTQVQGPVDDSGIVPVGPRTIGPAAQPAPSPTQTPRPAPVDAETSAEITEPAPVRTRAPTAIPTRQTVQPRQPPPQRLPSQTPVSPQPAATEPVADGRSAIDPIPPASTDVDALDSDPSPQSAGIPGLAPPAGGSSEISAQAAEGGSYWWWLLAGLVAAIAAVAGFALYRRRQLAPAMPAKGRTSPGLMPAPTPRNPELSEPTSQPEPRQSAGSSPAPAPVSPAVPVASTLPSARTIAPLGMETQIVRMQRSMMALTVTAKIAITNRGSKPIENAVLQGDLVGASAKAPLGEQLASSAATLGEIEKLGRIEQGERREVSVQVRTNLGQLQGIRQGSTLVFVPLLRVRIAGDEGVALASTVMVGHPPAQPGGKPTPFLAEAPPQIYDQVVGRALG